MPKLTILTPTYNRAHTLPRVYGSLKNQTFKDFVWLIMDDGSTDQTRTLITEFIAENQLQIDYRHHANMHKLCTVLEAFENHVLTPYFYLVDSDDELPPQALEILYTEMVTAPPDVVFVAGLAADNAGNLIGDYYPADRLECTIFDMRYKYRVRGDKGGLGRTDLFKKIKVEEKNLQNIGFVPEGVYQYQFDTVGKHRFINKIVRIYNRDQSDEVALSNGFYADANARGLSEAYRVFVNTYKNKFFNYPVLLLKKIMTYIVFSQKAGYSFNRIIKGVDSMVLKVVAICAYLPLLLLKHKNFD